MLPKHCSDLQFLLHLSSSRNFVKIADLSLTACCRELTHNSKMEDVIHFFKQNSAVPHAKTRCSRIARIDKIEGPEQDLLILNVEPVTKKKKGF
jgi:hypothetical protein